MQPSQDAEKQKEHYSGKKKRHTRAHITGSTRKKPVILLTQARSGKELHPEVHQVEAIYEKGITVLADELEQYQSFS